MNWTPTAVLLALVACAPSEPHPVFAELEVNEITLPPAQHIAPSPSASFKVENTGASTLYVTAATSLSTGAGRELLVTDLNAYTPVSPGQRIPVKISLDPRKELWDDGSFTVQFKLDVRYYFSGQADDEPEPIGAGALPEVIADIRDLTVNFTIDCDLDNDGVEAAACGGDDCDDTKVGVRPGVDELCNAIDDDCDGAIDDFAVDATLWYFDFDGDGYGEMESEDAACARPGFKWIERGGDCNDESLAINPAAVENCSNGIDDDCNGKKDNKDAFCQ